jgi:hypothetical protein
MKRSFSRSDKGMSVLPTRRWVGGATITNECGVNGSLRVARRRGADGYGRIDPVFLKPPRQIVAVFGRWLRLDSAINAGRRSNEF